MAARSCVRHPCEYMNGPALRVVGELGNLTRASQPDSRRSSSAVVRWFSAYISSRSRKALNVSRQRRLLAFRCAMELHPTWSARARMGLADASSSQLS